MTLTREQEELRVKALEKLFLDVKTESKKEAAFFYRKAIAAMFKVQGLDESKCISCGKRIWWVDTKNKNRMPYTADGISHFADCPNAAKHRKKK